jgi:hypothetical protein
LAQQRKLSQLISDLLQNYLQILIAHRVKGAYRNIHSGGWGYDIRRRLDIRQSRVGQALIIHEQHSHRFHSTSSSVPPGINVLADHSRPEPESFRRPFFGYLFGYS